MSRIPNSQYGTFMQIHHGVGVVHMQVIVTNLINLIPNTRKHKMEKRKYVQSQENVPHQEKRSQQINEQITTTNKIKKINKGISFFLVFFDTFFFWLGIFSFVVFFKFLVLFIFWKRKEQKQKENSQNFHR